MRRGVDYTLLITTPDGATVTEAIGAANPRSNRPGWSNIDAKPRHMAVGFGEFTVAAHPAFLSAVSVPDARVVVQREDDLAGISVEMSGPIESQPFGYQAERDGADGYGSVTVRFASDDAPLTGLHVYPNPAQPATGQTTTTRYTIAGVNPEDAMRALVNLNAGPGALAARRVSGLVLGADNNLMPGVTVSTSFTRDAVLTDALREVSRLAGGLGIGYRVRQVGTAREFQTFAPRDLSGSVVFGRSFGNVESLEYEPTAPTCTVALVGAATAGVGRVVRERINTAAIAAGWGRREVWVDGRGAANAAALDQLGDKALAEGAATYRVALVALETPETRWAYDLWHGDQVSAEVAEGVFVTALVQGADITVTPDRGEKIRPIVATSADSLVDAKTAELRKLWRTMSAMQGAL